MGVMTKGASSSAAQTDAVFDELLVLMAQSGDRGAFERLHARWHVRLARAARRYTANSDAARDLTQECWLAIWKGIGSIRDPRAFRAFAFGVLHRRGSDHLRGAIRNRTMQADLADVAQDCAPTRPEDRSALLQAFDALPDDQRIAAHLFFVEGLTLTEIAEVQSIPTGTAKSRLFHARRKLKAALTDLPEGDTP